MNAKTLLANAANDLELEMVLEFLDMQDEARHALCDFDLVLDFDAYRRRCEPLPLATDL